MIQDGRFREDLYYRLTEIIVDIPPLRERPGDPSLLAHAFLDRLARAEKRSIKGFTPDALHAIEAHAWPGNVREMENLLRRAVIMTEGPLISTEDLGLRDAAVHDNLPVNLRQVREEAERRAIVRAMARTQHNIAQTAELLGVSRPTLYDLMSRYGLK